MYTVYVHISPGGKRYYGSTQQDVDKRWKNGYGYKGNEEFWEDIMRYGWNNIEHIVVAKGLTKDEAHWLEMILTLKWSITNPNECYNINYGFHPSEETKKKMRKTKSEEHKKKLSKPVICLTTKRIFPSISEGEKYYGILGHGHINACCKGKRKSAGKYQGKKLVWRYLAWNHNKRFRIKGE